MKKRVAFVVLCIAIISVGTAGCGVLDKECGFVGCDKPAALFKDYCKTHQKTMDIVDGVKGIFD